jgi:FixJ family two-component response regulator
LSGEVANNLVSVVDDDASMCKMLTRMIGSVGLTVAAFTSAEEFLRSGKLADSACLILDVDLPGMSGIDLQRQLNDSSQHIPIIFISGQSDEKTRKRALNAGAAGFFKKPFSIDSLLDTINSFVTA